MQNLLGDAFLFVFHLAVYIIMQQLVPVQFSGVLPFGSDHTSCLTNSFISFSCSFCVFMH